MIHKIKEQNGFTIIEVIIVSGLMMITAMAVLSLISSNQKATATLQHSIDFWNISNTTALAISSQGACSLAIAGQPDSGSISFSVPGSEVHAGKKIGALTIEEVSLSKTSPVPGASDEFFSKMTIEAKSHLGKEFKRDFNFKIKAVAGKVIKCSDNNSVSLSSVCDSLNGTFDSINEKCNL